MVSLAADSRNPAWPARTQRFAFESLLQSVQFWAFRLLGPDLADPARLFNRTGSIFLKSQLQNAILSVPASRSRFAQSEEPRQTWHFPIKSLPQSAILSLPASRARFAQYGQAFQTQHFPTAVFNPWTHEYYSTNCNFEPTGLSEQICAIRPRSPGRQDQWEARPGKGNKWACTARLKAGICQASNHAVLQKPCPKRAYTEASGHVLTQAMCRALVVVMISHNH